MSTAQDRRFEYYLSKINDLPSLPAIVTELTRLIDNPMISINQIEQLMSKDQGLTLKVLKLANSAYYSIPGGARNLNRAITYLGFASIKQMILTATLFKMFESQTKDSFDANEFWSDSVATAAVAELISKVFKLGVPPEDAFVCGLVHDMGKLVIRMVEPEIFDRVLEYSSRHNVSYEQAERDLNAPKHTHWGQILAQKWKLPQSVQSAVRDHHTDRIALRMSALKDTNDLVDSVYIANRIVDCLRSNSTLDIEPEVLRRVNVTLDGLGDLKADIVSAAESGKAVLENLKSG